MTISNTSFWAFLRAFGSDWLTRMSGPASVPLAAVAIFEPKAPLKILFGCLAVSSFLFSSYRVWRTERLSAQRAATAPKNERQQEIDRLTAANAELLKENERLRIKPYDEAHRKLVDDKLKGLSGTELDLLRFLLHRGRTDHAFLERCCQDTPEVFRSILEHVRQEGLISRTEQLRVGRSGTEVFWEINPALETAIRHLLPLVPSHGSPRFII